MKVCPYCAEDIKAAAIRCRYCHADLTHDASTPSPSEESPGAQLAELDRVTQQAFKEVFGETGIEAPLSVGDVAIQTTVGRVEVTGTVSNRSGLMGSAELRVAFWTEHGTHLGDGVALLSDLRAWEVRPFAFQWASEQLPWLSMIQSVAVDTSNESLVEDPERFERLAAYESTLPKATIALREWKGRKFRTTKPALAAKCLACSHPFQIAAEDANNLTAQTGTISKLGRGWDNYTAIIGAWDTGTQSTNAGKQLRAQRADDAVDANAAALADAYHRMACPSCGSLDVLVEPPR